jgi:hypothetical protein
MVLRFYGRSVPFGAIEDDVLTSAQYRGERIGFSTPGGVASGLRRNGVTCKVTRGSLRYLRRQVSMDRPCVALLRSGRDMWHWVVVVGYTREGSGWPTRSLAGVNGSAARTWTRRGVSGVTWMVKW